MEPKNKECPICRNVYSSKLLQRHIQNHEECPEAFDLPKEILKKIKLRVKSKTCKICTKVVLKTHFKRHLELHYGIRYQCPRCPETFTEVGNTRNHLLKVHHEEWAKVLKMEIKPVLKNVKKKTKSEKTVCPICSKDVSKINLKRHLDIHKDVRHHCPRCPRTLSTISDTRRHILRTHNVKAEWLEIKPVGSSNLYDASINDIYKLD